MQSQGRKPQQVTGTRQPEVGVFETKTTASCLSPHTVPQGHCVVAKSPREVRQMWPITMATGLCPAPHIPQQCSPSLPGPSLKGSKIPVLYRPLSLARTSF